RVREGRAGAVHQHLRGDRLDARAEYGRQGAEKASEPSVHPISPCHGGPSVALVCFDGVSVVLRVGYDLRSRNRYPTPRTVSTRGSSSFAATNLPRSRARWTSTVELLGRQLDECAFHRTSKRWRSISRSPAFR